MTRLAVAIAAAILIGDAKASPYEYEDGAQPFRVAYQQSPDEYEDVARPFRVAYQQRGFSVADSARTVAYQQRDEPGAPRQAAPFTILQINDIYTTAPVDGIGGVARIATLKQQIAAATGRQPLMMLAGDFLSSSVESTVFKGEQMVAALNAAGLDVATLGNHELDFGIDVLIQRMAESKFQWVISNVFDSATNRPIGNAVPYVVRQYGNLRVGVIGLCIASEGISRDKLARIRIVDPQEAAATNIAALKAERVDVIVALTHLTFEEDRQLAERFPQIDVIVGGHEHFPITVTVNRTLISKAGSEGRYVARIDVNWRGADAVDRFYELIPVTAALPDEPKTAEVVKSYADRMGAGLSVVVGSSREPLDGETVRIRAAETNLGNLVADAMRANAGADVALINSGGIRGDRIYPAGSLARRTIIEMSPFGNIVCKVAVTGRVLRDALDFGVAKLPVAAGQFPQISGMTMRVDSRAPPGSRVTEVRVNGAPLDPARTYTLALPDFVLLGGDGYTMFEGLPVITSPQSGDSVTTALEKYLANGEVAPVVEGRIEILR